MSAAHWAGLIAALLVAANLLCLAIAFLRLRRKPAESSLLRQRPPVTIVRPVCGLESFSRETLTSGLVLDYPDAELLRHRDLPWVRKSCPCFDVKEWLKEIDFHL